MTYCLWLFRNATGKTKQCISHHQELVVENSSGILKTPQHSKLSLDDRRFDAHKTMYLYDEMIFRSTPV